MDPRRDRIGQRSYHEVTGDNICPSMIRGIDHVRDPRLNKVKKLKLRPEYATIQVLDQ